MVRVLCRTAYSPDSPLPTRGNTGVKHDQPAARLAIDHASLGGELHLWAMATPPLAGTQCGGVSGEDPLSLDRTETGFLAARIRRMLLGGSEPRQDGCAATAARRPLLAVSLRKLWSDT